MTKLLILAALVAMVLVAEGQRVSEKAQGQRLLQKLRSRRDSPPTPKVKPPLPSSVVEEWVTQQVDNFDLQNRDTWQQRYMMNGEHFQPGGCIFLFLSGEWSITEYRLENSMMEEMSREWNCYMFYLEHRYYGESRPTPDVSDANLRFLTVEQALADTAHFIEYIKSSAVTPGAEDSPVIVIGGQVSGSLAAWTRQTYPHLVAGAWASSAPVFAVYDHFQFKELAGAVYRHVGGDECYENIERGFAEMEEMVYAGRHADISEMFHLCNVFDDPLDVQLFFSLMSEVFSWLAQFDQIANVDGVCALLANETHASDAAAIASVIVYLIDEIGEDEECIDIDYQVAVEAERDPSWDSPVVGFGLRQYTYQLCTQFGWYHSSNSRLQPFGSSFPSEFRHQACGDIFDFYDREALIENLVRFNTVRGGVNPGVTNVFYVHGQLDPTRTVGVTVQHFDSAPVLVIMGASQGNDLGPASENDSEALTAAKEIIRDQIYEWIMEAQEDLKSKV